MDVDKESVRQVIQRLDIVNLHEQLNKQHEFFKKKSPENKRFKDHLRDAKNACVIADKEKTTIFVEPSNARLFQRRCRPSLDIIGS